MKKTKLAAAAAGAKGIQTLQTKRQAEIVNNMKEYTKELHQDNYNAMVARRVAAKLQLEIQSGDADLRKARQTGGSLPDMASKEQKQKHVDDELATAKRMEGNKIRKASEILGISGVPVKNRDNKAKTDGLSCSVAATLRSWSSRLSPSTRFIALTK